MTDRREQIAFPNQSRYYRERRPVRKIPTREQLEADPSYSGHSAGIHPEQPYHSDDYELEEDESYYNTNLPTSTRRYQVSPKQIYQSGAAN